MCILFATHDWNVCHLWFHCYREAWNVRMTLTSFGCWVTFVLFCSANWSVCTRRLWMFTEIDASCSLFSTCSLAQFRHSAECALLSSLPWKFVLNKYSQEVAGNAWLWRRYACSRQIRDQLRCCNEVTKPNSIHAIIYSASLYRTAFQHLSLTPATMPLSPICFLPTDIQTAFLCLCVMELDLKARTHTTKVVS